MTLNCQIDGLANSENEARQRVQSLSRLYRHVEIKWSRVEMKFLGLLDLGYQCTMILKKNLKSNEVIIKLG